jgi:tetratricopeptide (TPR) repeat protein
MNFQRDLEEPLTQALVDYATDPTERLPPQAHLILGPAGYGQTTLLRAIAAWFAKSRVGTALYLKPGAIPQEADIEFAVRHFPIQPVVFVVDNAADYANEVSSCVALLRQAEGTALFLLADRLNEWRQRRPSLRPTEHALLPLSDTEIGRLLESLDRTNSLGALTNLDEEVRFSTVKIRNQQDLLVTMREITDGRAFDAIVEDEFLGIASDRGREIYALASIFSRSRALLRADLCADILGVNIADLYQRLAEETEGVVMWEVIDEARGIEAIRTRHHIIANIVWARCLTDGVRERLILAIVDKINLSFSADAKAFDRFTRDDDLIASLRGLEAKIRFFESAIRKDPTNAFIRQHFARMLRRESRFDLALGQIDEALRMSPRARVLHHTRGMILGDLAIDAEVDEVARRRLAQSEQAFEAAINMAPRDDYAYTGLADLYLSWARRGRTTTDESILYVSKAQETVFRGLSTVRDRESLYLVTSNIEKFLGDDTARVDALRKALSAAPQSPVSRYLLGAVLFRTGEADQALNVLREGLTIHPDDPRIAGLCGLVMYNLRKSFDQILAVLDLARAAAADDSFYNATLGGMLTLAGRLGEAEPIWARARQRQLTIAERERVAFEISDGGRATWIEGRVATLGETYAFVRISGFPDVFCRPRKLSAQSAAVGQLVTLRVGFTVRGPVALEVRDFPSA